MIPTPLAGYIDLDELRDLGVIQEINRLLLHPRGMALTIEVDGAGKTTRILGLQDYRHDPEGMMFLPHEVSAEKAEKFRTSICPERWRVGFEVQPLPEVDK